MPLSSRLLLFAPLLCVALAGCVSFNPGLDGSGRVATETRAATGSDRISVEGMWPCA